MRLVPLILLGCLPLILAGCGKDPLDNLQKAAAKHQACMVKRTYKDECRNLEEALETARLTAVKLGSQTAQIDAAVSLGNRGVQGSLEASPYADFLKRRKEAVAANLIRADAEQLREDEALAKTLTELDSHAQPLSQRQKAEMLLIQSMLEEKYPTYFSEPHNGIETDPEILSLVCVQGSQAKLSQSCQRFTRR